MNLRFERMKNFVGGEFVEAERGEWERVVDPATGEVIVEVPKCAEEDVLRPLMLPSLTLDTFDSNPWAGDGCPSGV